MTGSNWNLRLPRTTRCDGHAIYRYKTPLTKRFFYALCDYGAAVFIGCVLAAGFVYGWSLP